MRSPFATALAIAFGLIVLIGYLVPPGVGLPWLQEIRTWIIDWSAILASVVTLIAILGLVGNHWNKLRAKRNPDRYSFFMLAGFVAAAAFGFLAYILKNGNVAGYQQVVTAVQVPVEASLMALLAVTLTLAVLRLFRRRQSLLSSVFIISVLVFLLLNSGVLTSQVGNPLVSKSLELIRLLPVAGGRGILLGIALGSIMAGLRIIFGADRPYSG